MTLSLEDAALLFGASEAKRRYTRKRPTIEVTCAFCGRVFLSFYARAKYCPARERDCYQMSKLSDRAEPDKPQTCAWCGRAFVSRRSDARYCCNSHKSLAGHARAKARAK